MRTTNHSIDCLSEEMLSAYLDGDLTRMEAIEVEAHLHHCRSCTATLENLETLKTDLAALAMVEAPAELWNQIGARHQDDTMGSPLAWLRRPWGWLGGMMLAATAAVLVVIQPAEQPNGGWSARSPIGANVFPGVHEAEQTYLSSIDALERALAVVHRSHHPEVQSVIEQDLAEIDKTIEECRDELKATPQDIGAHRGLLEAYQCKVDFLAELVE